MEKDLNFSEICVKCGMCCDGTLFLKAIVKDIEDEQLAKSIGLATFTSPNNNISFELPCRLFNKTCTIYDKSRPHICSVFFCEPLKKVLTNEITFNDAQQQVSLALETRKQVLELAEQIPEFKHFTIQQLLNEVKPKPSPEILKFKPIFLKLVSLRVILSKFVNNKQ